MQPLARILALTSVFLAPLVAAEARAEARTFVIDSDGKSQIQFVSKAPLETFTGKSTKASGTITVDPKAPSKPKASIRVPITSIDTHLELRNEHLAAENWLDAKKFPNAEFTLSQIEHLDSLKANDVVDVVLKGKFTIHGVTKDLATKARVRWTTAPGGKGDSLRVQATFFVKLEDHGVSIPSIVALKVAPSIEVNVDLVATAQ